jgi:hypothetical protein
MPVRDQEKSLENALHNQLKRSYVIDTVLSSKESSNYNDGDDTWHTIMMDDFLMFTMGFIETLVIESTLYYDESEHHWKYS